MNKEKRNNIISNRKNKGGKMKAHNYYTIRLNKFISNAGICSRREADKFISAGVVTVNGVGITEMGYKVQPNDLVKFNNRVIKSETLRYILLNKPKNYSGRLNSGTQTTSVMSLIASATKEKIYPIDRLKKTETGLLIFTNDTNLAKKIGSKNQKIKSIYQITLNKNLKHEDLKKIRTGIIINGQKKTFDSISYIQNKQKNEIGIEHSKGGIRHLKEIFEKLHYSITKLDRVFWGGLTKKNLPRKKYRHLSEEEISLLKRL